MSNKAGNEALRERVEQLMRGFEPWPENAHPTFSKGDWREVKSCLSAVAAYLSQPEQPALAAVEPVGPWCQPMDEGKHKPRHFIVRFDDSERGEALFTDEAEAREFWSKANIAWNCWLFGAMPLTTPPPSPDVAALQAELVVRSAQRQHWEELAVSRMHRAKALQAKNERLTKEIAELRKQRKLRH